MSNITFSQEVFAGHEKNLEILELSLPKKGLGVLFSSSGTVYCCLTALRDKLYIKKNGDDNYTQAKQPSIATSIIVRTFMEAAYALLAVTSIIELVVRGPLALLGLLVCKISDQKNIKIIGAALILTGTVTLTALMLNVSNLYFNTMNAPIGKSIVIFHAELFGEAFSQTTGIFLYAKAI